MRGIIPLKVLRHVAPCCEKLEERMGMPLVVTPYSVYTLGSNGNFSSEKARKELGYSARPIEETLADIALWIRKERV